MSENWTVSQLAKEMGVTPKTLHHYDAIGLLMPNCYTDSGYRIYGPLEAELLQQIIFFKEIGFSLNEIKHILNHPGYDRRKEFKRQLDLLKRKREDLDAKIDLVKKVINAESFEQLEPGKLSRPLENQKMIQKENDIEDHIKKYATETRAKYGKTSEYRQSQEKIAGYTKANWDKIKSESGMIYSELAKLMNENLPVSDLKVQKLVYAWHEHINQNFYDCSIEVFQGLAQMYVTDSRFEANIDQTAKGLAKYLSEGMLLYCENAG